MRGILKEGKPSAVGYQPSANNLHLRDRSLCESYGSSLQYTILAGIITLMRNKRHTYFFVLLLVLLFVVLAAAKDAVFTMPRAFHAKTYPARDEHKDESFTIAADPYDMPDKQAKAFATDFAARDLVPIHMIFTNDGGQTVSLAKMRVVLITKKRQKLLPESLEDLYRHLTQVKHRVTDPQVQLPIPLPKHKAGGMNKQTRAEVDGSQLLARAVEPHATQGGFLFFDIEGIENPLAGARIEITGITNDKDQELFYFEIPLEKYLGYQPVK